VKTMDENKLWRKMIMEKKEMEVEEINGSQESIYQKIIYDLR